MGRNAKNSYRTLGERIRRRIELTKIVIMLLSVILYTAFSVVMLLMKWGSTIYIYIVMLFVFIYTVIFVLYLILAKARGSALNASLRNYKSGLAILKALLTLFSLGLTLSVFSLSLLSDINSNGFQIMVLVITFCWAVFQIVFQITRMIKRWAKKKKYGTMR